MQIVVGVTDEASSYHDHPCRFAPPPPHSLFSFPIVRNAAKSLCKPLQLTWPEFARQSVSALLLNWAEQDAIFGDTSGAPSQSQVSVFVSCRTSDDHAIIAVTNRERLIRAMYNHKTRVNLRYERQLTTRTINTHTRDS